MPRAFKTEGLACLVAAALPAVAFAAPTFAQAGKTAQAVKFAPSATADFAGNGKSETATVHADKKADWIASFTLTVGAAKVTVPQVEGMDSCKGLRVVQVDNGSRARQIIVALGGTDDIEIDYFFGFDGAHLFKLATLNSSTDVPGNGALYNTRWMDFWTATEKTAVDVHTRRVQNVAQPLYYVGTGMTATASFPLLREKSPDAGIVATVAPNSKVLVVAYAPDTPGALSRGDHGWYLIKSQTGLCGWARLKTFQDKQTGLTFAD